MKKFISLYDEIKKEVENNKSLSRREGGITFVNYAKAIRIVKARRAKRS